MSGANGTPAEEHTPSPSPDGATDSSGTHLLGLSLLRSSIRGTPHQQGFRSLRSLHHLPVVFRPFRTPPPACAPSSLQDFGATRIAVKTLLTPSRPPPFCKLHSPKRYKNDPRSNISAPFFVFSPPFLFPFLAYIHKKTYFCVIYSELRTKNSKDYVEEKE